MTCPSTKKGALASTPGVNGPTTAVPVVTAQSQPGPGPTGSKVVTSKGITNIKTTTGGQGVVSVPVGTSKAVVKTTGGVTQSETKPVPATCKYTPKVSTPFVTSKKVISSPATTTVKTTNPIVVSIKII